MSREDLPMDDLDFASRSLGAATLDHYGIANDQTYEAHAAHLLNRETILHEIDIQHSRGMAETIDLSFIEGESGVFL